MPATGQGSCPRAKGKDPWQSESPASALTSKANHVSAARASVSLLRTRLHGGITCGQAGPPFRADLVRGEDADTILQLLDLRLAVLNIFRSWNKILHLAETFLCSGTGIVWRSCTSRIGMLLRICVHRHLSQYGIQMPQRSLACDLLCHADTGCDRGISNLQQVTSESSPLAKGDVYGPSLHWGWSAAALLPAEELDRAQDG